MVCLESGHEGRRATLPEAQRETSGGRLAARGRAGPAGGRLRDVGDPDARLIRLLDLDGEALFRRETLDGLGGGAGLVLVTERGVDLEENLPLPLGQVR